MTAFTLRDYQRAAVEATLKHFRKSDDSAVIVLPTGAGKSLVIAELARLAKRKILVLAHVKELVEQNHAKYHSYGLTAGIYSAGLKQKETQHQVTFASVQSVARNLSRFAEEYSLLIVDECHRINDDENSQYGQIIQQLTQHNTRLKVLGLTATPYRMGMGWIYRYHYHGFSRADMARPFQHCIYELPLKYMIKQGYLTAPRMVDAPIAQYDFSSLQANSYGNYADAEVNQLLVRHPRVTRAICEQIIELAQQRQGVMVFAATVEHANEIHGDLPGPESALITGTTDNSERDRLIRQFKQRQLKYLVNVAVLTTGFDAPHVDMIALLRPTQSVSLFQQIVGRGLRLAEGKQDCLVMDYAGTGFDLFYPEVGQPKPDSDSVPVQVFCPQCAFANVFWGKTDADGQILEHFGRRCQGLTSAQDTATTAKQRAYSKPQQCDFRFRFKECRHCNAENDIAARRCRQCGAAIIDPDDQLKAALKLKDALVIRCCGVTLSDNAGRLKITYHDEQGDELSEQFDLENDKQRFWFNQQFGRRFAQGRSQQDSTPITFSSVSQVLQVAHLFMHPDFVIARKSGRHWRIKEKLFDYQGNYRKANQL